MIAAVLAALVPLLPTIERAFREAWGKTDSFAIAWAYVSPAIPAEARPHVEVLVRAAWDSYSDGEIETAWGQIRAAIERGEAGITRAVAPDLDAAIAEQHRRADQLTEPTALEDGSEWETTTDPEIATGVHVLHPKGET